MSKIYLLTKFKGLYKFFSPHEYLIYKFFEEYKILIIIIFLIFSISLINALSKKKIKKKIRK